MKIILCTTPIRPVPSNYPAFGSMALIQYLRKNGYDPIFYDIDTFRPSMEEVLAYYKAEKPDLIAISAVVSTAYAYVKKFCAELKKILPNTPILVGGNLAASAELLHRMANVDLCCVGEGEKTFLNVVKYVEAHGGNLDPDLLQNIRGLSFINKKGDFIFTGYELAIPANEFQDPDYSILERFSKIDSFITEPDRADFARDPRMYQPHRKGQKMAALVATKGCVARCTFCHRFDKGYRTIAAEDVVRHMKDLRDKYNVGFFCFGDENFGSDTKQVEDLIRLIKPMDVLYMVGGVRCRTVNPELLKKLHDSGCVALYYGMETGSPRMLQIMEKNASLEMNLNAARWTGEAGMYTCYQMVMAMPGETNETVAETLAFSKTITEHRPEAPHNLLSINYIQALPGTPVYELARENGLIGKTLQDENDYLLRVSDIDANDDTKFLNFTEEDYYTVQHWRHMILLESERHWYKMNNWKKREFKLPSGAPPANYDYYTQGGYFNLKKLVHGPFFYRYLWWLRPFYYAGYVLAKDLKVNSFPKVLGHIGEYLKVRVKKRAVAIRDYRSLRRIVKDALVPAQTISQQNMQVLRDGR